MPRASGRGMPDVCTAITRLAVDLPRSPTRSRSDRDADRADDLAKIEATGWRLAIIRIALSPISRSVASIDRVFRDHPLGERGIGRDERMDRIGHHLLRHAAHFGDAAGEVFSSSSNTE